MEDIMILYIFLSIIFMDMFSVFLFHMFRKEGIPFHHNVRWFFIHFFINTMVTVLGFFEMIDCFYKSTECANMKWGDYGEGAALYAIISHLYHIALFFKHLREDEWIHHIVMCLFAFPVMFNYNPNKVSTVAIWFITGLPGMIDYLLLWLVKIGRLHKQVEKSVYVILTVAIRSPGCVLATALQLPHLSFEIDIYNLAKWFLSIITLWNGQYYMYITVKNSGKHFQKNIEKFDKVVQKDDEIKKQKTIKND